MKKKVNKSALIKEVASKNPTWKASEIAAQMKKDGMVVSLPLVYQAMRGGAKKVSAGKKRGPKPKAAAGAPSMPSSELFSSMQSFVSAAGGLDKAIALLNIFNK